MQSRLEWSFVRNTTVEMVKGPGGRSFPPRETDQTDAFPGIPFLLSRPIVLDRRTVEVFLKHMEEPAVSL